MSILRLPVVIFNIKRKHHNKAAKQNPINEKKRPEVMCYVLLAAGTEVCFEILKTEELRKGTVDRNSDISNIK